MLLRKLDFVYLLAKKYRVYLEYWNPELQMMRTGGCHNVKGCLQSCDDLAAWLELRLQADWAGYRWRVTGRFLGQQPYAVDGTCH